jgi:hypothetical protein
MGHVEGVRGRFGDDGGDTIGRLFIGHGGGGGGGDDVSRIT